MYLTMLATLWIKLHLAITKVYLKGLLLRQEPFGQITNYLVVCPKGNNRKEESF